MSKLYRIEMKFYKCFYVEANSQDEALAMDCVDDQQNSNFGRAVELEHDETTAREAEPIEEERVRTRQKHRILKDD